MDPVRRLCIIGNSLRRDLVKTEKIGYSSSKNNLEIAGKLVRGEYVVKKPEKVDNFPELIGKSKFKHFESIILANIDVSYDVLTPQEVDPISSHGGSIAGQVLVGASVPTSLHIGANNTGFADYIQYRYPLSFTYINMLPSITVTNTELQRFTVIPTGGISHRIMTENPKGIDIVLFNGEPTDTNVLLTLSTCMVLSPGGKLILRLNASDGRFVSYLELLSHMFTKIYLFKPCTIDLHDSYIYVICKGYIPSEYISKRLNEIYTKYISLDPGYLIESLIDPSPGINAYISQMFSEIKELRADISGSTISSFPPRALIYWGLSGTPE